MTEQTQELEPQRGRRSTTTQTRMLPPPKGPRVTTGYDEPGDGRGAAMILWIILRLCYPLPF